MGAGQCIRPRCTKRFKQQPSPKHSTRVFADVPMGPRYHMSMSQTSHTAFMRRLRHPLVWVVLALMVLLAQTVGLVHETQHPAHHDVASNHTAHAFAVNLAPSDVLDHEEGSDLCDMLSGLLCSFAVLTAAMLVMASAVVGPVACHAFRFMHGLRTAAYFARAPPISLI